MSKLTLMQEPFVHILLDTTTNLIIAKWNGFLKGEDVRKGCSLLMDYILDKNLKIHMSDHRQLKILSKEVQSYLVNEWFPQAEQAGLQKIGAIVADDVFAAATVNKVNSEAHVGALRINMFNSETECEKWLLQSGR
ncbi:MAG TPA: hypothetical protein VIN08_05535 [Ohtaekwangia sp.]|uniref:hypothetical protein n=1 Tax=Ohtaekwangia sp. TaxID=2066019 RepID=UPI002F959DA7